MLPSKGTGDAYNITKAFQQVEATGHTKIIYKSDDENAITALKREATRRLRNANVEVVPETSPAYDSASNGMAEAAVREVKGVARSLRTALALLHNADIPADHPVLTWLVAYAAGCINRSKIGGDGRTPHERHKGKSFRKVLPPFGESIMFLPSAKRDAKFEERWKIGIFLGVLEKSSEMLVGFDQRVIRARSIKRRAPSERADATMLLSIKGVPWAPTPDKPDSLVIPAVIDKEIEATDAQLPKVVEFGPTEPRSVYIRKNVELARYGYTEGCPGCAAARDGRTAKSHNAACRERIERAMADDPELGPRVFGAEFKRQERQEQQEAAQPGAAGAGATGAASSSAAAGSPAAVPMAVEEPRGQVRPAEGPGGGRPQIKRRTGAMAIGTRRPQAPPQEPGGQQEAAGLLQAPARSSDTAMDADSLEICALLEAFGDWKVGVSELYGPGRFTSRASAFDLEPGTAFDLRLGYDFTKEADRTRARATIELEKPLLVVGSPICAPFSNIQTINAAKGVDVESIQAAVDQFNKLN